MLGYIAVGISALSAGTAVVSLWLTHRRGGVQVRIQEEERRERRWTALTPQLGPALDERGDRAGLRIRLSGPLRLQRLDRVTVKIRDDMPDRGPLPTGQQTAEDIAAQIWGPYRLNPNVKDTDPNGRAVTYPDGVDVGEDIECVLERSLPPHWSHQTPQQWQDDYDGKPLRFTVVCERAGEEPWVIPLEVPRRPRPVAIVR
jgi:hypothetical protein